MLRLHKSLLLVVILSLPGFYEYSIIADRGSIPLTKQTTTDLESQTTVYIPEQFGEQRLLWVWVGPDPVYVQLRATLLSVGNYCYVYMANESIETLGQNDSIAKCDSLKLIFDETIYPKAIELAGHPDGIYGDIDGDPHITIFLAPLVQMMGTGYLGYYLNQMENPAFEYSNVREMVYVDSDHDLNGTINIIIHELNHLIWLNNELDEAQFLLEGLANFAIDYTGYTSIVTHYVTTSFLSYPEISLLYFNRNYGSLWDSSYGQAYLFMTYFIEQFGVEAAKDLVAIPEDGAKAVERALIDNGYTIPFNQVFLNWITACVIDDSGFAEGIYGFESINYKISGLASLSYDFPFEKHDVTHYYYGFRVNKILPSGDNYTFVINNPYPYSLGISIIVKENNGWNVTQKLINQDTGDLSFYIEGEDIQDVYIITSLMSPNTPSAYGSVQSLDIVISRNLSYTIHQGFYELPNTEKGYYDFTFFIAPLFIAFIVVITKRRKK